MAEEKKTQAAEQPVEDKAATAEQPSVEKKKPAKGKKVRIIRVRVRTGLMFNGKRYTTGDELDMPETAARDLLERHFVEKVEAPEG